MLAETRREEDRGGYLSAARERIEDLERLLLADLRAAEDLRDEGWDDATLRDEFGGG